MSSLLSAKMMEEVIWNASAADISTLLPASGDLVYYLPEAHAEYAHIPLDCLWPSPVHQIPSPFFLCRVASLCLSTHPISDEVFAKLILHPLSASSSVAAADAAAAAAAATAAAAPAAAKPRTLLLNEFAYHTKVLAASDAAGKGIVIPDSCANSIFPKLDNQSNPPSNNLTFFDAHGLAWEFKHIYLGNPLEHLLTTGWNSFVEFKKLVQGDTVIFIRGPDDQLYIRIRRNCTNRLNDFLPEHEVQITGEEGVFTRKTTCRNSGNSMVAAAASRAAAGRPFEVMYYPYAKFPEFVLAKELVDDSTIFSSAGFRHQENNDPLPPSRLLETKKKKRKAVNSGHEESVASNTPFYPASKRFKVGEGSAGQEAPHGEAEAETESESSSVQVSSAGFMPKSKIHIISSDSDSAA